MELWTEELADRYREWKHGPDGIYFLAHRLDGYLNPDFIRGKHIFDGGMGPGRFAIEMLRRGARFVHGVDLSGAMVQQAEQALAEAGLTNPCYRFQVAV